MTSEQREPGYRIITSESDLADCIKGDTMKVWTESVDIEPRIMVYEGVLNGKDAFKVVNPTAGKVYSHRSERKYLQFMNEEVANPRRGIVMSSPHKDLVPYGTYSI